MPSRYKLRFVLAAPLQPSVVAKLVEEENKVRYDAKAVVIDHRTPDILNNVGPLVKSCGAKAFQAMLVALPHAPPSAVARPPL